MKASPFECSCNLLQQVSSTNYIQNEAHKNRQIAFLCDFLGRLKSAF